MVNARFLPAVLLLFLGPSGAAAQEGGSVRVGIYQNRPKVFLDEQNEPQGIFVDLIRAAAESENWKLEFVPGTWSEGLDRLTRSEIDLMPDVSFSPEREQQWAFNREPVLSDWFQIICPRHQPINSILDLEGKQIAVLQASVQQKTLSSMASDFDLRVKILPMPDYDTGLQMIREGRTDLMVANRYLAVSISETEDLCVSPVIFHPTRLHVASPPTGHRLMLDAIDRHLIQWKTDPQSVYYRTLKRWTGEAPETVIPRYIRYLASAVASLILLISAIAILLRWQVRIRTRELRRKTGDLEIALQKLKETQEKAIQQERLHALGQMASGIAHDFNNILTPIIGLAEALLLRPARLEDQDLVKKDLKNIIKAGYDGAKIVNRMKAFYRVYEPEESRLTDPCESIETVIELSRPRWARRRSTEPWHMDIKTRLTRGLYIRVRETEFREALLNLLGNAMDAMPSGGLVTVGVRQEARTVVVSVQDTGTGMSPDVKEKSLSAFFTTKGQAGTGIGLTMVKTFCDHSKAKLEIETEEGQGTTVSLIFPLHNRNAPDRLPESDSL